MTEIRLKATVVVFVVLPIPMLRAKGALHRTVTSQWQGTDSSVTDGGQMGESLPLAQFECKNQVPVVNLYYKTSTRLYSAKENSSEQSHGQVRMTMTNTKGRTQIKECTAGNQRAQLLRFRELTTTVLT